MTPKEYSVSHYPMLIKDYPQETRLSQSFITRWIRQKKLPEKRGVVLIHNKTTEWIGEIAEKYSFNENQIENLSRIIRDFGFLDIQELDIPLLLEKNFSFLSPEQRNFLLDFIIKLFQISLPPLEELLPEENSPSQEYVEGKKSPYEKEYPLLEGMALFSKLGQQLVTSENIMIRGSQTPVRPSVKNWITLYQQEMGPAPHEAFERSNFLFHNKNVLALSPQDRERITSLLTSLDENILLPLDIQSQEILWEKLISTSEKEKSSPQNIPPSPSQNNQFPQSENEKRFASQKISPSSHLFSNNSSQEKFETKNIANAQNIHFSSSHLFPKEREDSE